MERQIEDIQLNFVAEIKCVSVQSVISGHLLGKLNGHAFNFSNEIQLNVLDLTLQISRLMEREDLAPIILNEVRNEIKHQYLSAEKARSVLGWEPKFSLDDGLSRTIDWYRNAISDNR